MEHHGQTAIHIARGEGSTHWLVGDTYTCKISGAQTGGAFTLLEATVSPGGGPPPHVHNNEDEVFVILDGELRFSAAGDTVTVSAGSVLYIPKGTPHSFTNVSGNPVSMLFLYTPAGMDEMFPEIGTPAVPGQPVPPPSAEDVAKLFSVAQKYGFSMLPSVSTMP